MRKGRVCGFPFRELGQGITLIEGYCNEYCFLVEGLNRALLIDTLIGFGDIKAACEKLTSLPITVVNTHGHFDHAGGNFSFDEVYIHPRDRDFMYKSCMLETRKYILKHFGGLTDEEIAKGTLLPPRSLLTPALYDRQLFELGGRTLEVVETPGHTQGSVCFLDRENRIIFLGDTCNTNTLICLEGCTTVEEYMYTLFKLRELMALFDVCYIFHEETPLDKHCITEAISCCEDILAGQDDAWPDEILGVLCRHARNRASNNKLLANVAYLPDKKFVVVSHRKTSVPVIETTGLFDK